VFGKKNTETRATHSDANALDAEEKKQFAEWLELQDPSRRKQYLKLAQAYGFSEDAV